MLRYIWVKGRRYYYYESYSTWKEAHKMALYWRKKNGSRWWIQKGEAGIIFPGRLVYRLYLSKAGRLTF